MRKSKLDVLMITRSYPPAGGGVSTHVYYLAYALSKLAKGRSDPGSSCHVRVLAPTGPGADEGIPPSLVIHRLAGEKGHFLSGGDVPLQPAVQYGLDNWWKMKPDLIHAHDFESLQIGVMLKAAFKAPLILTIHKAPKEWDKTAPQRDAKDCYLQALLDFRLVDKVVAPSKAYAARLIGQGFPPLMVPVIPHGVPIQWLCSWPNEEAVLSRLGVQTSEHLILCPTRLDPHKAVETFIDAAAILRNELNLADLQFLIAGDGPEEYRRELQQRARDRSVEGVLRIAAFEHKEMATLYRHARLCVLPSRREGFGQVILEAFVFGCPVVAANTGGIPELVHPQVTGLLFNRDEPHDLAHQVQRLLQDHQLREFVVGRAFDKVSREFNAEKMAKRYFELYRKVTSISVK